MQTQSNNIRVAGSGAGVVTETNKRKCRSTLLKSLFKTYTDNIKQVHLLITTTQILYIIIFCLLNIKKVYLSLGGNINWRDLM